MRQLSLWTEGFGMPTPIPLAGTHNIKVNQGATLSFGAIRKDHKKRILPMPGYTARMQVRPDAKSSTITLSLTTENGGLTIDAARALVWILVTDEQTSNIPTGKYVYDLELLYPTGEVERLIAGSFTVDTETTR
jgi:hypothetical protein